MPKLRKQSKRKVLDQTFNAESTSNWQVQTAKARFSEVFRQARLNGPQRITRQGKDGVVMIAQEEYDRLVGRAHQPASLVQFFRESPLVGAELDLARDRAPARDIEL
jgi:antitoxin Phd